MNEPRPPVVFEHVTVHERRLRIARWLGWTGFVSAFAPPIVSLTLQTLFDVLPLVWFLEVARVLAFSWIYFLLLCPVLALVSGMFARPTMSGWRELTWARLDASGISFRKKGHERRIERSEITDAMVQCAPSEGIEVHLVGGNVLAIHLPDEAQARAAVNALGFAADEHRVTIRLASPQRMVTAGCVGLAVSFLLVAMFMVALKIANLKGLLLGFGLAMGTATLTLLIVRAWKPPEIVVGTDGVLVRRPFSKTYIPYSSVDHLEMDGDRLRLFPKNPDDAVVQVKGEPELVLAAASRIEEARAAGGASAAHARVRELLDRKGRSLAEWRTALTELLQGGDYRNASITEEALLAVLQDSAEDRGRRIGAAMLLRVAAPEAAPRIRIAAEASADDELRAALERAAEEELDDATLERALRVTRGS
ncbi:hypothetical protein [Polyangium jinanense]|uniref:Uncharacterized protein n=1 Tax=Polyangium jinanense TaxID=2829994 RepID=A0A9X3X8E1_9BACT|nr:hypothetical protein [Polyangium jinanense]MDC3960847.1 hypothetical protein [Polyangium jinanense]MDC3984670.1 hypothetical protein [Polyangium jinanense]